MAERITALDLAQAELSEGTKAYFAKCEEKLGLVPNVLLAYEPPHRLVFTFGGEKGPDRVSEVEFRLEQEGDPKDNKVRFTLTHTKIPDRGYMLGVSGGWHSHLDVLGYRLRGETPPAFWDIWRKHDGAYEARIA